MNARKPRGELEDPSVWQDPKRAQELGKKQSRIQNTLERYNRLKTICEDDTEMPRWAEAEGDLSLRTTSPSRCGNSGRKSGNWSWRPSVSGPYDSRDAF